MTQEEKNLLLKDLCGRLTYGVKATTTSNGWRDAYVVSGYTDNRILLDCPVYDEGDDEWLVEFVKPYLRPMSSMTEEEKEMLKQEHIKDEKLYIECIRKDANGDNSMRGKVILHFAAEWCNKYHFDYRGLIEKGLALEAPEGMYKID